MAILTASSQLVESHVASDRVRLRVGTPDALDLAASTPAGGRVVAEVTLGDVADLDLPQARALETRFLPGAGSQCSTLPVATELLDAAGNVGAAFETWAQLDDAPAAPPSGGQAVTATANPNEARFTFEPSPDIDE